MNEKRLSTQYIKANSSIKSMGISEKMFVKEDKKIEALKAKIARRKDKIVKIRTHGMQPLWGTHT